MWWVEPFMQVVGSAVVTFGWCYAIHHSINGKKSRRARVRGWVVVGCATSGFLCAGLVAAFSGTPTGFALYGISVAGLCVSLLFGNLAAWVLSLSVPRDDEDDPDATDDER